MVMVAVGPRPIAARAGTTALFQHGYQGIIDAARIIRVRMKIFLYGIIDNRCLSLPRIPYGVVCYQVCHEVGHVDSTGFA